MRRRIAGADLLRVVALLGVVVIHACAWPHLTTAPDRELYGAILLEVRFSVPVFVVLSGLLVGRQRVEASERGAYMRRRLRRSLVPLVAWAPVYLAAGLWVTGSIRPSVSAIGDWIEGGAGHLYFLALIPQLYLVGLMWPRQHPWVIAAVAMAIQEALDLARLFVPVPGGVDQLMLWHGFELFPFWTGYFGIGVAWGASGIREPPHGRRGRWATSALAVIAASLLLHSLRMGGPHPDFAGGTGAFLLPTLAPLVFAITALGFETGRPLAQGWPSWERSVRRLSDLSLGVYIVHPLVMHGLGLGMRSWLSLDAPASVPAFITLIVATIVISAGITRALLATPLASTLGSPRRRVRAGP